MTTLNKDDPSLDRVPSQTKDHDRVLQHAELDAIVGGEMPLNDLTAPLTAPMADLDPPSTVLRPKE